MIEHAHKQDNVEASDRLRAYVVDVELPVLEVLEAIVKPENHRMLDMLRESGFPVVARSEPGEVHAEIPTVLTPEGIKQFEDRSKR